MTCILCIHMHTCTQFQTQNTRTCTHSTALWTCIHTYSHVHILVRIHMYACTHKKNTYFLLQSFFLQVTCVHTYKHNTYIHTQDGSLYVHTVCPGSSAEHYLFPGDILVQIGTKDVYKAPAPFVADLLLGPAGSEFEVCVYENVCLKSSMCVWIRGVCVRECVFLCVRTVILYKSVCVCL
jgi:hypothetical protein